MNYRIVLIILVAALGLGYYVGKELNPRIETKEIETIKKDVVTVIREVTRPDGTKETVTEIVDRSKEKREDTKVVIQSKPDYHVSATAVTSNFREIESYTISAERRMFGPVFMGVQYNTQQTYGLTVGFEF